MTAAHYARYGTYEQISNAIAHRWSGLAMDDHHAQKLRWQPQRGRRKLRMSEHVQMAVRIPFRDSQMTIAIRMATANNNK